MAELLRTRDGALKIFGTDPCKAGRPVEYSGATDVGEKLRVTAGASYCSSENIWNNARRMHSRNLATKLIPQAKTREAWHLFGWWPRSNVFLI